MDRNLYLVHHGIKGMKWGRRRWQDRNGDLTEEGKKHYSTGRAGAKKAETDERLLGYRHQSVKNMNTLRKSTEKWNKSIELASKGRGALETGYLKEMLKLSKEEAKLSKKDLKETYAYIDRYGWKELANLDRKYRESIKGKK